MLFSVNQASHLYVVNGLAEDLKTMTEGQIAIVLPAEDDVYGDYFAFAYKGKGGVLRSDLIPVSNVMHSSMKTAEELKTPYRAATITLDPEVDTNKIVAGQDYLVRIQYSIGSIDNQYLKYGVVRATNAMVENNEKFFIALEESLKKNFAREEEPVFAFTHTASSLIITELEPKWVLGTYPQRSIDFEVSVDTIEVNKVEGPWGKVTIAPTSNGYANSKKIADLEYFCMGERGDIYRNYNWPNVIPTEYMVDATDTTGYDVINIHYAYTGSNESVQKSEKDIYIVCKNSKAIASGIYAKITAILAKDPVTTQD